MSDTKSSGSKIEDLQLRVKTWAVPAAEMLGIKSLKKAKVEVNWGRVTFTPENPEWSPVKNIRQPPSSRVVYSSTYHNHTGVDAEHTVKVERTSTASWTTSVKNGYTTGFNLGLALSLPNEVVSATADFGRSVTVETTDTTTREHVQTWSVETAVPSPAGTKTKARVEVVEKIWEGEFTLPVRIKGIVVVNFYDQNTPGNHLGIVEEDVTNLLRQCGGEVVGSTVRWTLRGTCKFQFGVEQVTHVEHEKISAEEPRFWKN